MNPPAIIVSQPAEHLTLSDFDQCMLLTEEITNPIRLRHLHESVSIHPQFRNQNLTWKAFKELLKVWSRRYPGSKTMACMFELNENKEWAFKTYKKGIPEMVDALTQHIQPQPSFSNAIGHLVEDLDHLFGVVTHSHRDLVWAMLEHMRCTQYIRKKTDVFDIVDLHNDGKHTGIGWLRVVEHFEPQDYITRNWLDDCLRNHHLPGITRFERFYIRPTEPSEGLVEHRCDSFTDAMDLIAQRTIVRQAA